MARGQPGEEGYQPEVSPEDFPRKLTPRESGANLGPALAAVGSAWEVKQRADAATWASDQLSNARLQAVKTLEDMKSKVPSGDPGNFAEQYLSQFDKNSEQLVSAAGANPYAHQIVNKGLDGLRTQLGQHALEWEATQRVAYRTDSVKQNLTNQLPIVEAHPELAVQVGSTLMDQINAIGGDPSQRLELARQMHGQLSLAAANGLARQDARSVITGLNNPDQAPPELRGLTDQQLEAVRAKANEHLSDPILSALTEGNVTGAQRALNANKDILDPKTAFSLQRTIDAQVKERQNEQRQEIADRYSDSMTAAQYGLPNAVQVTRKELDILYPHDAERRWDGLQSMVAAGAQAREYDQMTPAQIQADLAAKEPKEGGPEAAFKIKDYDILARAAQQSMRARTQDPAQFAIDSGAGWKPLAFDNPQALLSQLKMRASNAQAIGNQIGVPVALLTRQESAQMGKVLDSSPPAQKLDLLTSLHQALPDERAYYSVVGQVLPHSPVTAIAAAKIGQPAAGEAPSWYDPTFAGKREDAERILAGEALINPQGTEKEGEGKGGFKNRFPMPPEGQNGLQPLYARAVGDMFRDRPQLADATYGAFRAAYASLLSEKGDLHGTVQSGLVKQALNIAVGHTVDFNGNTLAVPAGMNPSKFKSVVRDAVAQQAVALNAPKDWQDRIRGYQLREIGGLGSGRYELVQGNAPLVRPDGKGPFMIDLHGNSGPMFHVEQSP